MLIAEELLLLGLEPERGKVVNGAREQLRVALAGALIAELMLSGLAQLNNRRIVTYGGPPAEPCLRLAHRELDKDRGRHAATQLDRLSRRTWSPLVDGLVERGVLDCRRRRVLMFNVARYPMLQPSVRDRTLAQVRAAATADFALDPRMAVLLALAGPSRLLEVVAPDKADRKHARHRIAEATELVPIAPIVKKVISNKAAAEASAGVYG